MKSVITGSPDWHPDCYFRAGRGIRTIDFQKEDVKMDNAKIYGICLERLKHQIKLAKQRVKAGACGNNPILLECYNTGDIEEIVDILELYDVEEKTRGHIIEKCEELACTISELSREVLMFDYTGKGHLGLYLFMNGTSGVLQEKINPQAAVVPV